ncbi:MAG: hypothetical protein M0R75_11545 [Dehalococcoidia bacterium]|nr:hypothetical protein [Dehalococcoidia bacterium]
MFVQLTERTAPGSLEDFQQRVNAAFRAQFPTRDEQGEYHYRYVVATFDSYVIAVHDTSEGEQYFRYDMAIEGEDIAFTSPQQMELRYVPVEAVAEAVAIRAQRVTQPRQQVRETRELAEAAAAEDGATLTLTVIRAGLNVAKSRYYTEAAVQGGAAIFRGLKMYIDHQTRAEEQSRPEGSLKDWAAVITETAYDPATKSLRATAKLIDPTFKAKVQALAAEGLLGTLGVSIRAVGAGEQAVVEGVNTFRVDEFVSGISVDFVTEPGAGGQALLLESATEEPGIDALTLPQLRERRPDLVAALLSQSKQSKEAGVEITQEEYDRLKAQEAEARSQKERADAAEAEKAAAESALEESKAAAAKAAAQESIRALIAESKLPEPSVKHLTEVLRDEADVEKAKAAIESHKTLVASLTGKGAVAGNGGPGSGSGGGSAPSMAESLQRLGVTKELAESAVRGK